MPITFTTNQSGNLLRTQQPYSNPTINSGISAGGVYNGLGDDFLDPDKILDDINKFSGSVNPATSNTWTSRLVPAYFFNRTDDPGDILNSTNNSINNIFSPNFGQNLNFSIPTFANGVPDFGANPDPTKITLGTLFFANGLQSPSYPSNPNNFNPFLWENPNSTNILTGVLNAQNSILYGTGFPYPSYPFPGNFSMLG